MAFLKIQNIAIKGISACVPENIIKNCDYYEQHWGDYPSFFNGTGIASHRNTTSDICSSDLCKEAAERLIEELQWDKAEVNAIVFVSQTPDYKCVPATSNCLQERLGLPQNCLAIDISLGCSGWVYALSVLSSLMQSGEIKKGLLLAGDTPSKFCNPEDKSTFPLFGDAGTATALEFEQGATPMQFSLFSDGSGYDAIIIEEGGYRKKESQDNEIIKSGANLYLDGTSVFTFGISKAPKCVKSLEEHFNIKPESIDCFTFHQANLFMNEKIRKKLDIPKEKVPYCLDEYGNTSCASIPLTLVTRKQKELRSKRMSHIACGFGVGLSWGAVSFFTDSITIPDLIEI